MNHFLSCAVLGLSLLASALPSAAEDRPGSFDFYVLSLSWSPTFCTGGRAKENPQQCAADKDFRFIVHGLWPQNEKGYPQSCASTEPSRVPAELGRQYFDIMPSMGLIGHQWRKHGSCTGLNQADYLKATRSAYDKIKLPQQLSTLKTTETLSAEAIEQGFVAANPGLTPAAIAVSCEGSRLEEVRICLSKDLTFRPCREVDRQGCSLSRITIPPAN
ncbi:ribonuclease T2 family protein [Rhizobium sp. SAFR-030]|uniref:ribonuclease T2 family protein n=1 Tax=Rhizobium sp. SAFR-030 TaxID=3387277 RepID=UPI003F81D62E